MVDEQRPATQEESAEEPAEELAEEPLTGHAAAGEPSVQNGAGAAAQLRAEDEASPQAEVPGEGSGQGPAADGPNIEAGVAAAGGTGSPDIDAQAASDHQPLDEGPGPETDITVSLEAALEARIEALEATAVLAPEAAGQNIGLVSTFPEAALPPRQYFQEEPAWLPPEFERQAAPVLSPPLGRAPGRLPATVLALLMSGVFAMFLLIEPTPTWVALFGAIIGALGTDGVLRSSRREIFEADSGRDTLPHLFLPTLFALAAPLFIEENLQGYWVLPAAALAGFAFVLIVLAEVPAEAGEAEDEFRGHARFVSVAATYFVAFALFSLTYAFDLGLREALIAIALVSVLLAVELLREGEIDPLETLLLAGVVGIVVAEARWVLQFMPLDRYPAGLGLLLSFYFVTGIVHAYMTRQFNVTVAAEYSIVTGLGLVLVVAARATGIA